MGRLIKAVRTWSWKRIARFQNRSYRLQNMISQIFYFHFSFWSILDTFDQFFLSQSFIERWTPAHYYEVLLRNCFFDSYIPRFYKIWCPSRINPEFGLIQENTRGRTTLSSAERLFHPKILTESAIFDLFDKISEIGIYFIQASGRYRDLTRTDEVCFKLFNFHPR